MRRTRRENIDCSQHPHGEQSAQPYRMCAAAKPWSRRPALVYGHGGRSKACSCSRLLFLHRRRDAAVAEATEPGWKPSARPSGHRNRWPVRGTGRAAAPAESLLQGLRQLRRKPGKISSKANVEPKHWTRPPFASIAAAVDLRPSSFSLVKVPSTGAGAWIGRGVGLVLANASVRLAERILAWRYGSCG